MNDHAIWTVDLFARVGNGGRKKESNICYHQELAWRDPKSPSVFHGLSTNISQLKKETFL